MTMQQFNVFSNTAVKIRKAVDNVIHSLELCPEAHKGYVKEAERLYRKLNVLGVNYWHEYAESMMK
jgi:hypothetical protein